MLPSYRFILLLLSLLPITLVGQECKLELHGVVSDHETEAGLELVNVYILENDIGAVSDADGHFHFTKLCPGDYHLVFSHIGCDPEQRFITLNESKELNITLEHSSKLLEGVIVTGHHVPNSTQSTQAISVQSISDNLDENLSTMLEDLSGVSTMRNGSGIAKPIVQGLFGNRITILNNGIAQSGQQWGNDHSPEIDPMVANRISVVKGVSALEFPGSNLGSVIIVEPSKIKNEPHLHGSAAFSYGTNGRAASSNLQLYKASKFFRWKVNGTYKRNGDMRTPDYFLSNSGVEEANLAIQVERQFSDHLYSNLYFSTFNADIGVLRGSHVGNITDLSTAFERDEPFFTSDDFTYAIEAPKQRVNHNLVKSATKWFLSDDSWFDFTLAFQYNNRKEFDVRRSGRTELPALSLAQETYFAEVKYNIDIQDDLKIKVGLQSNLIDNTNDPETGILPLIPDYLAVENGAFAILSKRISRSLFEFGFRYEYIFQDVPTITRTLPYEVIRFENHFNNINGSLGWKIDITSALQASLNLGYAMRNPGINELYSNGLHQGVSGIEEGRFDLKQESSFKSNLAFSSNKEGVYGLELLFYYQRIEDYIFLKPSGETRLTIRGAFPVFRYEQTDAEIYGFDLSGQVNLSENWLWKSNLSYIRGNDLSESEPLFFIPPNNFRSTLTYKYGSSIQFFKKNLENFEVDLENQYVFEQVRFVEGQDFLAPPMAYNLLGISISGDIQLAKYRLRIFLRGDNLLNKRYRDYLNRQRYFADDIGRNVSLGGRLKF